MRSEIWCLGNRHNALGLLASRMTKNLEAAESEAERADVHKRRMC